MNTSKTMTTSVPSCRCRRIETVVLILLCGFLFVLAGGCGNGAGPAVGDDAPIAHAGKEPVLTPAEVGGLPVYPGLRRVSSAPAQEMTINQAAVETLPVAVAFSDDPAEDVMAFYADHLPDRNVADFHGTRYFWQGDPDEEFNPLDMQKHVARPSVSVMPPLQEGAPVRVEYIYEP